VHVEADTIPDAWHDSLRAFVYQTDLVRYDSMRGPCSEVQDALIRIRRPLAAPMISEHYPGELRSLVDGYAAGFLNHPDVQGSTVSERLYAWGRHTRGGAGIDQVARAEAALRNEPESRFTILTFWDPAVDPGLENPVSPLVASLRVRDGALGSTLTARSVDAWLGAFPMLIGFASLVGEVAARLELEPGPATYLFLSYHLYDVDLPVVRGLVA